MRTSGKRSRSLLEGEIGDRLPSWPSTSRDVVEGNLPSLKVYMRSDVQNVNRLTSRPQKCMQKAATGWQTVEVIADFVFICFTQPLPNCFLKIRDGRKLWTRYQSVVVQYFYRSQLALGSPLSGCRPRVAHFGLPVSGCRPHPLKRWRLTLAFTRWRLTFYPYFIGIY